MELREALIIQTVAGLQISRKKAEKLVDEWLMPVIKERHDKLVEALKELMPWVLEFIPKNLLML